MLGAFTIGAALGITIIFATVCCSQRRRVKHHHSNRDAMDSHIVASSVSKAKDLRRRLAAHLESTGSKESASIADVGNSAEALDTTDDDRAQLRSCRLYLDVLVLSFLALVVASAAGSGILGDVVQRWLPRETAAVRNLWLRLSGHADL